MPIKFYLLWKDSSINLHVNWLRKCFVFTVPLEDQHWVGVPKVNGVIWGPALTHWEMLGGTAPRVISPASLGGPGLNHGRLAKAMHRATLRVLGLCMFGWEATVITHWKWFWDYTLNFHQWNIVNVVHNMFFCCACHMSINLNFP